MKTGLKIPIHSYIKGIVSIIKDRPIQGPNREINVRLYIEECACLGTVAQDVRFELDFE